MNITAGKFKGQKITAPDEKITRPTLSKVRMSVFNTLQAITDFDGKSFLDMYAGSGIMALEAVSRGFASAVAIEKHPKVAAVIKNNYKKYCDCDHVLSENFLGNKESRDYHYHHSREQHRRG